MKVLHIIHWPKSGITALVRDYISKCKDYNTENFVAMLIGDEDINDYFKEAAGVYDLHLQRNKLAVIPKLMKLFRQVDPDIIHVHSFLPLLLCALLNRTKPIVTTIHNSYPYFVEPNLRSKFKRLLLVLLLSRNSSKSIAVSRVVFDKLIALGVSLKKLTLIENSVPSLDDQQFESDRTKLLKKWRIPDGRIILAVGRLHQQKNFSVLIDSFQKISHYDENLILVIAGNGPDKHILQSKVEAIDCRQRIFLLGYCPNPAELYAVADYYVCSSLYEGFSLSILEAMRAGLPILSTPVGVTVHGLVDGKNVLITKGTDESAITEGLTRLINMTDEKSVLGRNALAVYQQNYSFKKYIERIISFYHDVINKVEKANG